MVDPGMGEQAGPDPWERDILPGVLPYEDIVLSYAAYMQRNGGLPGAGMARAFAGGGLGPGMSETGGVDIGMGGPPERSAMADRPRQTESVAQADVPEEFIEFLQQGDPDTTTDLGRSMMVAFDRNPGSVGRLWQGMKRQAESDPGQVPVELRPLLGIDAPGTVTGTSPRQSTNGVPLLT